MIEPHQRATLFPNPPGVSWHHFLGGRFIGPSFGFMIQAIQQETHEHAELRGLFERSSGGSLPVVSEFTGALNIGTREITVHETQTDRPYSGQFSENGRVLTLRLPGKPQSVCLVHEETLAQMI